MNKVKLSKSQDVQLKMMIAKYQREDLIIKIHAQHKLDGTRWMVFPAINDLSIEDLESALLDGYDVVGDLEILQTMYNFHASKEDVTTKEAIEADIDYQLATLHDAIENGDSEVIEKTKEYLADLTKQLEGCE